MGSAADDRFGLATPAQGSAFHEAGVPGAGRAHARHEVRLRAEVGFGADGAHSDHDGACRWSEARIENIGFGGACLAIDTGPPADAGDVLRLSLVAPSLWDPLVLRGRIVWVDARLGAATGVGRAAEAVRRLGVAFVHEKPWAVLALHDLISTLAYE